MRRVFAAVGMCALTTGLASAQMKAPAPSANPLQVTTSTAAQAAGPSLESARRISRDESMKLVRANKAVYVDVRSKESFAAGHIKGALSIPGSLIVARVREIPTGKLIITYCA